MVEAAIPEHLQQKRLISPALPSNYAPPYPSYCARFPTSTKEIVMAIFGVQCAPSVKNDGLAMSKLVNFIESSSNDDSEISYKPLFWELASVTDNTGAYNEAVFAYWPSKSAFSNWEEVSGFKRWWQNINPEEETVGWFLEIFFPPVERFETLFTDNEVPEGAAHMRESMSSAVKEHGYWGSMRDRLPISQTDALQGEKWVFPNDSTGVTPTEASSSTAPVQRRIYISGKKNLAVIRSGQDWSNTSAAERKLYLDTMHPVLINGMNFLRDNGSEVGCYSCRLMDIIDSETHKADKDRTFGLAYFDSLGSLEGWSKEHKTHLAIFGGFMQYAKKLGPDMSLRAFHEVLVLESDQQHFEYIGCHGKTGMLVTLS